MINKNYKSIFYYSIPYIFRPKNFIPSDLHSIEEMIRFKTHFTYLHNIYNESPEELDDITKKVLVGWISFQKFRINFCKQFFSKNITRRFATLKALNIFEFISPIQYPRFHNDIDLLLDDEEIIEARDLLIKKHGFTTGNFSFPDYIFHSMDIDYVLEAKHYELCQISKFFNVEDFVLDYTPELDKKLIELRLPVCYVNNTLHFHLTFDLHKNISLEFSKDEVWDHFIRISPDKNNFCMTIEDLIWYSSLKSYYEIHTSQDYSIRDRIRHFVDIYILIHEFENEINWDLLYKRCSHYEMQPALFYALNFVGEFLNSENLSSILSKMDLDRRDRKFRSKDYGSFTEKLFYW